MATKTLNTRIINKHADLSVWNSSTLELKTGEIALARVETTKPDGHGGFYKVPTYLMKVGDGEKTFSQLEWLAAPASDVYAWAKKEHMSAADMPVLTEEDEARILPGFAEDIAKLQAAVGSGGTVAEAIQLAIEALDVTDTEVGDAETQYMVVTAVSETDGKISVTRKALAIKDITGLQAALDAKLDVATYNTDKAASDALIAANTAAHTKNAEDIAAVKATADAAAVKADVDAAFEATNAAVATAQGAAEGAQATADAAVAAIGTGYDAENTVAKDIEAVKAAATAEAEAREAADEDLQGQITAVKATADAAAVKADVDAAFEATNAAVEAAQGDATSALGMIGTGYDATNTIAKDIEAVKASVTAETEAREAADEALDGRVVELETKIVNLSGAMHFKGVKEELPTDYENYADGDVVIVGNKEYVYDSATEGEVKFVEFGDVDDVSNRVTALENNSATKAELESAQNTLQGNIDLKADQTALDATNEAVAAAQGAADAAQAAADAAQGAADAAQATADAAVATIGTGYDAENTVAADIAGVKASVTAETEAREAADEDLQGQITAVKATADAAAVKADVDAAFEATNAAVEAAQADATSANDKIGGSYDATNTVAKDIEGVKASVTAETEAREAADEDLQGQITAVKATADAAAVKATVDASFEATNAAVATAQATADAAAAAIGGTYAEGNTVASDIESVKASVQAIADDYLTAADTYIFDCGGAV